MSLVGEERNGNGGADDVFAASKNASFPLHDAAGEGRLHVVRLLLDRGHRASSLDCEGLRASDRARAAGHHELAAELEQCEAASGSGLSMPREVAPLSIKELFGLVQGKSETVASLIAAGRVHAIDGKGDTPLHICAAQGRLQFCDQLIMAGANPSALNFEHKKPHDRAAENGHTMVAGLLQSLLPKGDLVGDIAADPENETACAKPPDSPAAPLQRQADVFDFDDLDLEFDGEEDAEDYHRESEQNDYVATFDALKGRITRLGFEESADLGLGEFDKPRFKIEAEDIVGPLPQTAEFADAARFRSFLDVRMGRSTSSQASPPFTRFYAIADNTLIQWIEAVIEEGACNDDDVDTLIGSIRGSFDAETVRSNLVHELTSLGLFQSHFESPDDAFVTGELPDLEDIFGLLSCICNGSNIRPGMELKRLSARAETQLFRELAVSQKEICRTLVSDALLVSIVLMLGERVATGTVDPGLLTDLDIQHGRQTPDSAFLSDALSYLVSYQIILEEGDATSDDRLHALETVSAMKLSRMAVELIAKGIQANSEFDATRQQIEALLATREQYRQKIMLEHMPLVRRLASKREAHIDDVEDLVHDGIFGLMRSIDLFEPDRGNRFMTYCQFGVRQSISRALDDTGSLVRVPSHRALVLRKVDKLEESIAARMPAEAMIAHISEELEIPADDIRKIRRIPRRAVPFEELHSDCLDVESPQFRDYLADQRRKVIEEFLAGMPERASDVIVRRFGLRGEDEMTLEELGAMYGVTRERIRQIEAKQLTAMSHPAHQRLLRNLL